MVRLFLAYGLGRTFPRLVAGLVFLFVCFVIFVVGAAYFRYEDHPTHYEMHGQTIVEVPGKLKWAGNPTGR